MPRGPLATRGVRKPAEQSEFAELSEKSVSKNSGMLEKENASLANALAESRKQNDNLKLQLTRLHETAKAGANTPTRRRSSYLPYIT